MVKGENCSNMRKTATHPPKTISKNNTNTQTNTPQKATTKLNTIKSSTNDNEWESF